MARRDEARRLPGVRRCGRRPLAGDTAEFLAAGDKPIVFTPVPRACICACLLRGGRGSGAALTTPGSRHHACATTWSPPYHGPDVHVCRDVPFRSVLPHAAAVVHQAGIGTTSQCLCRRAAGLRSLNLQPTRHGRTLTTPRRRPNARPEELYRRPLAPSIDSGAHRRANISPLRGDRKTLRPAGNRRGTNGGRAGATHPKLLSRRERMPAGQVRGCVSFQELR